MNAVITSLSGLVFLVWVVLMFAALFALRGIGRGPRFAGQPGLGATLDSYRIFLTAPEWRTRRRRLGLATLAVGVVFPLRFYLGMVAA